MKIWLPAIRAGSGADVYTQRLALALCRSGHDVVVTWLPLWLEPFPSLSRVQLPEGTDLIHANSWNAFAFARFGKPVVVTAHLCVHDPALAPYKTLAQHLYHELLIRPYERRSFDVAQAILAVSNHTRSSLLSQFGSREITVVHNWVDTEMFRPAPGGQTMRGARPFRLLYAGNRSARKGWDVLPELMSLLGSEFELSVACGLRGDAPTSKLSPNTRSLGAIRDEKSMAHAYQQCDALIMPSRLEGFGYVTAEAMACGKPVVAFRNSAAPEIIVDRETGLLIGTDDIEGMATACRQLAENSKLADQMGRAGRHRVEEKFSEMTAMKRYISLYEKVLDCAGQRTLLT